jgi:hypothetical protein
MMTVPVDTLADRAAVIIWGVFHALNGEDRVLSRRDGQTPFVPADVAVEAGAEG